MDDRSSTASRLIEIDQSEYNTSAMATIETTLDNRVSLCDEFMSPDQRVVWSDDNTAEVDDEGLVEHLVETYPHIRRQEDADEEEGDEDATDGVMEGDDGGE